MCAAYDFLVKRFNSSTHWLSKIAYTLAYRILEHFQDMFGYV